MHLFFFFHHYHAAPLTRPYQTGPEWNFKNSILNIQ